MRIYFLLNHWVMHPVACVSISIYRSLRTQQMSCSFYCALLTLHVSAPIGGHFQVVCNTKNSKVVTIYVIRIYFLFNHWVMHPVARVSISLNRNLCTQQMSVLVLLCTSYNKTSTDICCVQWFLYILIFSSVT
jgi:hypothetical protein